MTERRNGRRYKRWDSKGTSITLNTRSYETYCQTSSSHVQAVCFLTLQIFLLIDFSVSSDSVP
jgi:hypothetical protein